MLFPEKKKKLCHCLSILHSLLLLGCYSVFNFKKLYIMTVKDKRTFGVNCLQTRTTFPVYCLGVWGCAFVTVTPLPPRTAGKACSGLV